MFVDKIEPTLDFGLLQWLNERPIRTLIEVLFGGELRWWCEFVLLSLVSVDSQSASKRGDVRVDWEE